MSIASEITRLQGVKSDILTAIENKGVTVPAGSALADCPDLIASIPTGTPAIPNTYQQLMYCYINGNSSPWLQYFVNYTNTDRLELQMQLCLSSNFTSGSKNFVMYWIDTADFYYQVLKDTNKSYFHLGWYSNNVNTPQVTLEDNLFINLSMICSGGYVNVNINGTTVTTAQNTDARSVSLFPYNGNEAYFKNTKFFALKIFDGNSNKLKRYYVPAVRISDGVVGIYDLLNNIFVRPKSWNSQDSNGLSAGPVVA